MEKIETSETEYERIDLGIVCKEFELDENEILGCFIFGSRTWSPPTCLNKNSDWDLFMIIKDQYKPLEGNVFHTKNKFDICIYNKSTWDKGVENHQPLIIFTRWLPKKSILKNTDEIWEKFELDLPKLRAASGFFFLFILFFV